MHVYILDFNSLWWGATIFGSSLDPSFPFIITCSHFGLRSDLEKERNCFGRKLLTWQQQLWRPSQLWAVISHTNEIREWWMFKQNLLISPSSCRGLTNAIRNSKIVIRIGELVGGDVTVFRLIEPLGTWQNRAIEYTIYTRRLSLIIHNI